MDQNVYEAPKAQVERRAVVPTQKLKQHAASIKALGYLWLLFGAIFLLATFSTPGPGAALTAIGGLICLVTGYGSVKFKAWGYYLGIILCGLIVLSALIQILLLPLNAGFFGVGLAMGLLLRLAIGGAGLNAFIRGRSLFGRPITT